jgi:hypothetical protein
VGAHRDDFGVLGLLLGFDYRDYKGTFAVSYKQVNKGRLFNFREGTGKRYRFEFPDLEEPINTDTLSEIDGELLAVFMKRVEELG